MYFQIPEDIKAITTMFALKHTALGGDEMEAKSGHREIKKIFKGPSDYIVLGQISYLGAIYLNLDIKFLSWYSRDV